MSNKRASGGLHIIGQRPDPITISVNARMSEDGKRYETNIVDQKTGAPITGVASVRFEVDARHGASCTLVFAPGCVSLDLQDAPAFALDLPAIIMNAAGKEPVALYDGKPFTLLDAEGNPEWILRAERVPAPAAEAAEAPAAEPA